MQGVGGPVRRGRTHNAGGGAGGDRSRRRAACSSESHNRRSDSAWEVRRVWSPSKSERQAFIKRSVCPISDLLTKELGRGSPHRVVRRWYY